MWKGIIISETIELEIYNIILKSGIFINQLHEPQTLIKLRDYKAINS